MGEVSPKVTEGALEGAVRPQRPLHQFVVSLPRFAVEDF